METAIPDDPEFDCTDAAHPAWWRGCDYGTDSIIREVTAILDGKQPAGSCSEPWESLRKRLAALTAERARIVALVKQEYDEWKSMGKHDEARACEMIFRQIESEGE